MSLILAVLPCLAGGVRCGARGPGFGWFRAPGRYVVLSSLGLCLAAGAGFDRAAGPASIRRGMAMAWAFAMAAAGWAVSWSLRHDHRAVLGGSRFALVMGSAALSWVVATALLLAWRRAGATPWPGCSCWPRLRSLNGSTTLRPPSGDGPLTFHRRVRCWPDCRRSRKWPGSRGWSTTCPSALRNADLPLHGPRRPSAPPGSRAGHSAWGGIFGRRANQ